MKTFQLSLISIAMLTATSVSAVELNGSSLTQDDAWAIAEGAPVSIAPEAMDRVKKSYELVLEAAKSGKEIYGLTVGVGLNKDHKVISANGELSEEVKAASRKPPLQLQHSEKPQHWCRSRAGSETGSSRDGHSSEHAA